MEGIQCCISLHENSQTDKMFTMLKIFFIRGKSLMVWKLICKYGSCLPFFKLIILFLVLLDFLGLCKFDGNADSAPTTFKKCSLAVSDLRSETKGSQFDAEASSLQ